MRQAIGRNRIAAPRLQMPQARRCLAAVGSALFTVLFAAVPALAQSNDNSGWHWRMHDGWNHMMGWGGTMFGGLMMLVFWIAIIVVVVLLVRGVGMGWPSSQAPRSGPTALEILQERYAKGEISKEEYDERKKTLQE